MNSQKSKNEMLLRISNRLKNFSEEQIREIDEHIETLSTDIGSNESSLEAEKIQYGENLLINDISAMSSQESHTEVEKMQCEEKPLISDISAIIGDKWGHCKLSDAIEDGDIGLVKQIYQLQDELSDADLLRKVAAYIMDKNIKELYNIDEKVVFGICSGIEYQLRLMGESIEDIVFTCDEE